MGNKMGVSLSSYRREYKKKTEILGLKGVSELADNKYVADDVFLTPRAYNSDTEDEENKYDDGEFHKVGECSDSGTDSPDFVCEICIERRDLYDSFSLKGCAHFYCIECIIRYVASILDDNRAVISCPASDCPGVLEPEYCRVILPKEVFDRWGIALCESVIDVSKKLYCPYMDCSALLVNDTGGEIERSYCPFCKRAFCVRCMVPWHSDISCRKFQKLKKKGEDVMLKELAKRKKWRRCPKCKYYVEKSMGCFRMKCRYVLSSVSPSLLKMVSKILDVDILSVTIAVLLQVLLPMFALGVSVELLQNMPIANPQSKLHSMVEFI
ncbi:unnamed protein product [Dovyalis caffra]|uniref:RBR-type E3 ubiquitin transferase n=1 Tax=Dovyalis caffra TaxID=77055 RepID=A0AAV1SK35_9ROSI|nr:unnamed protein product [Dovyalis caffra]